MRRGKIFALLLALILAFSLAPAGAAGTQEIPTTVEVNEGETITLLPGETVTTIPLDIKGIPDLGPGNGVGAFTFHLTWGPTVIHVDDVTAETIAGFAIVVGPVDNVEGTVTIAGFSLGTPLTGDQPVATLDISAQGAAGASTSIGVTIDNLVDMEGSDIPATPVGAPVEIIPFDFSLEVSPTEATVIRGGEVSATVTATHLEGITEEVTLTYSLPEGVEGITASFDPEAGTPDFTSTMTIAAATDATLGEHLITITGTSAGGLVRTTTFTLTVIAGVAETGISQGLDDDEIAVLPVKVIRVKDPITGETVDLPGGLGAYEAKVTSDPADGIEILDVRGTDYFPAVTFNPVTGEFAAFVAPEPAQPDNTVVAKIVPRLTGSALDSYDLTVAFDIIAAGDGTTVPEEEPNTLTFLRGDAKSDGEVNIVDAMFIAQKVVGIIELDEVNALNAASVKHDGESGDVISIVDAMYVAQYVAGLRDAYYDWIGD